MDQSDLYNYHTYKLINLFSYKTNTGSLLTVVIFLHIAHRTACSPPSSIAAIRRCSHRALCIRIYLPGTGNIAHLHCRTTINPSGCSVCGSNERECLIIFLESSYSICIHRGHTGEGVIIRSLSEVAGSNLCHSCPFAGNFSYALTVNTQMNPLFGLRYQNCRRSWYKNTI